MTFDKISAQIKNSESLKNSLAKVLFSGFNNLNLHFSEKECYDFFNNYLTEINTVYKQLEIELGITIEPAPDDWDRTYNVDFFIEVGDSYIGLQIKPIASGQALNQYQWIEMHANNHERFERDFHGKVFFVYSIKSSGKKKRIYNVEVIEQIKDEIQRLNSLSIL